MDRRELRDRQLGIGVVESDERDVLGHAQPHLGRCLHRTDGHRVVCGKYGGRPLFERQELLHRLVAGGPRIIPLRRQLMVQAEADIHERALVSIHSELGDDGARRTDYHRYPLVPQLDEVLHRIVGGLEVVRLDEREAGDLPPALDDDHGDVPGLDGLHMLGHHWGGEDNALDSALEKDVDVRLLFLHILGGVAEDDVVTGLLGFLFDCASEGRSDRPGDAGHDVADEAALLLLEAAGEGVIAIAEIGDGLIDPQPGMLRDAVCFVEDARNCGGRNSRLSRNVFDGRLQLRSPRPKGNRTENVTVFIVRGRHEFVKGKWGESLKVECWSDGVVEYW